MKFFVCYLKPLSFERILLYIDSLFFRKNNSVFNGLKAFLSTWKVVKFVPWPLIICDLSASHIFYRFISFRHIFVKYLFLSNFVSCSYISMMFVCRLSYFELNLETWRQLWRVLEMSDILLLICDVRHPVLHLPPSLYRHITKVDMVLICLACSQSGQHRWELLEELLPIAVTQTAIVTWRRFYDSKTSCGHLCFF